MFEAFTLSFRKDISLVELPQNKEIILQSSTRKLAFSQPASGLQTALKTLYDTGGTATELKQLVQQADGIYGMLKFHSYLQKFISLGWVCHSVLPFATAVPQVWEYEFSAPVVDCQEQFFTLSRFAYLHQVEGQMVLESPLSKAKVILPDWRGVAIVAKLSQPQSCSTLVSEIPSITLEIVQQFLSLLLATQMLSQETYKEVENATLAQWDFHDLLFHTRSRQGRHTNPTGSTYRFLGKIEPQPVVKPPMSKTVIQLYQPNLERLKTADIPLTQVLEERRSIRNYHSCPIAAQQLGEFLYRSARVKNLINREYSNRPYPAGGGLYELEVYPVINTCVGISSGLYHYNPIAHQLEQLCERTKDVEALLKDAWGASGQQDMPQVLIVISARFQRLSWKYEAIAYSLILKHIGVLYQTMYLVATAMNLAPCALGSGNADLFATAAGTDYYAESSVGEFMLGSQSTDENKPEASG
ncbi:dehydrogenase [Nostocales cyanobacterium HT-58-2]|nr:dehydrogenase [Nostocales cyanobacterium HT-58-2]